MCAPGIKAVQKEALDPLELDLQVVVPVPAVLILGIEPVSSGVSTSALNPRAFCLTLALFLFFLF